MSRQFRNLKTHLFDHLQTPTHLEKQKEITDVETGKQEFESRNRKVGMRCARTSYLLYKTARPYSEYEQLVTLESHNGCDMGNINHSRKFPAQILPFIADETKARVKKFLCTPLVQTGFLPPVKVIADKDTKKHRTRQVVLLVTIVPDAAELIQYIYLDHPIVKKHTGKDVAASITNVLQNYIVAGQFEGGGFDGQYFHLGVPKYVNAHYEIDYSDTYYDWDVLHCCGLVDTRLRKLEQFQWLSNITNTVSSIFKLFNWGKGYEELVEACDRLKLAIQNPQFFCETRFANSVRKVYGNFLADLSAIIACLENTKFEMHDGDASAREKAQQAEQYQVKIQNKSFCLLLSGLADIYEQYGVLVSEVQKVNLLPFQRFDKFTDHMEKMKKMVKCLSDHNNCGKDKCFWPHYHKNKPGILNGQFVGTQIIEDHEEQHVHNTRRARQQEADNATTSPVMAAERKLADLTTQLVKGFREDVYSEDALEMVESTRFLTDLKSLAMQIREKGHILLGVLNADKFVRIAKKISRNVRVVNNQEIVRQYKIFVRRLASKTEAIAIPELQKMDSKDLIKKFLTSGGELYVGCEMVVEAIVVAAIKMTVESIAESVISRYNTHNSKLRSMSEEAVNNELWIACNGPELGGADRILSSALSKYFRHGNWHFVTRKGEQSKLYNSKVINRIISQESRLPFVTQ
ncbi:Hypothetical predicted protein [Paramuricea clavata]|uniref:Uncharacterized protein n=1 Tax=Paramuricea clavata TaxID=317549 RepID=A0A7D9JNF5_PARCT|nr:Hypothetical predicted protein [Paramuricea clavata]